jgi:hypothetical protein
MMLSGQVKHMTCESYRSICCLPSIGGSDVSERRGINQILYARSASVLLPGIPEILKPTLAQDMKGLLACAIWRNTKNSAL